MRYTVDRLYEVRNEIKALRREHAAIRAALIAGEVDTLGDHYVAKVRRSITLRPLPTTPQHEAPQPHASASGNGNGLHS